MFDTSEVQRKFADIEVLIEKGLVTAVRDGDEVRYVDDLAKAKGKQAIPLAEVKRAHQDFIRTLQSQLN